MPVPGAGGVVPLNSKGVKLALGGAREGKRRRYRMGHVFNFDWTSIRQGAGDGFDFLINKITGFYGNFRPVCDKSDRTPLHSCHFADQRSEGLHSGHLRPR